MTIFKHSFITVCAMLAAVALVFSSCNNENEDDQLRVTLPDAPVTAYFDYGQTHSFTVKMEKERSYEIEQVPNGWTAQLESKTKLVVTAPKSGGEMSGVVKISVHRKERTVSAQLKVEILPATTLTANANSYIISKPNTRYKIKATVKGNSSQKIDGTPASAALVWQTSKGLLGTVMLDGDHISFVTTADYLESAKEKHENTVYYTSDKAAQAQYIAMFSAQDIRIAVCEKPLDAQFLSTLEMYDSSVKYLRIDAEVASVLKQESDSAAKEELVALFKKVSGNEELKVEFASLKDENIPALITLSEQSRRMEEMLKLYAMNGMNMGMNSYPQEITLTLNTASPLIAKLEAAAPEKQEIMAAYLYGLAQLSQKKLSAQELQKFLSDSYTLLGLL